MKKIILISITILWICNIYATPTPTVTPTVTVTVVSGTIKSTPTVTPTVISKAEIEIWRQKLNPVKKLNDVKPFLSIFSKPVVTDKDVIEYVKTAPVKEVIAVKTSVAIIEAKPTATKVIMEVIKK